MIIAPPSNKPETRYSLLSVIVPVYNSAAWLRPCLDSICNQSYRNLEILCVNDCSPDNSADILAEYAARDPRIRIINREQNGGVAAARNSGLDAATGELLTFVDPDDTVDLNAFGDCIDRFDDDVDLVCFGIHADGPPSKRKAFINDSFNTDELAGSHSVSAIFIEKMLWTIWSKLFRKSLIDRLHLRCLSGIWQDDLDFYFRYLSCCRRIEVISQAHYHWLIRVDSTSAGNGAHDNDDLKVFRAYESILNFVRDLPSGKHDSPFMHGLIRNILFHTSTIKRRNRQQAIRLTHDLFEKWQLWDVDTALRGYTDYGPTLRLLRTPAWLLPLIKLSWLFYERNVAKIKYKFFGIVFLKTYLHPAPHRYNLLGFRFGPPVIRSRES